MRDPYKTLGIPRDARQETVKQAYRRLAMELHPDRNPDRPTVADKFKDVNAAYALIGDPEKRVRFDRGDIDAWGRRRPKPPDPPSTKKTKPTEPPRANTKTPSNEKSTTTKSQAASEGKHGEKKSKASTSPPRSPRRKNRAKSRWLGGSIKADDLFGPLRTSTAQSGKQTEPPIPEPTHKLRVTFLEAARGTTKRLMTDRGRNLEVTVPAGIRDGQVIRLKDQGQKGPLGGRTDALVKVDVTPHKLFRTEGDDVHLEVPISLEEAILGAQIRVPTVNGVVEVAVPSGANSGALLRLRGKGLRRPGSKASGDQVIRLVIKLPQEIDPGLKAFVRGRQGQTDFDPRQNLT